jgi:hypothetical protein
MRGSAGHNRPPHRTTAHNSWAIWTRRYNLANVETEIPTLSTTLSTDPVTLFCMADLLIHSFPVAGGGLIGRFGYVRRTVRLYSSAEV